jgi:PAS domain S-box-containing protein
VLEPDELIVSKTDLKGVITYANEVFCQMAAMTEAELIGQPHNIIRHPDMPRCVFKLLWDTLAVREEVFAYVVNLAADGAHYWVFAHVTPTFASSGQVIGYHSNRRAPARSAVDTVTGIYAQLRAIEQQHAQPAEGMAASGRMLGDLLGQQMLTYDEFVWSVTP